MSDEPDRVAMLSDLRALERRLTDRLDERTGALVTRADGMDKRLDSLETRITEEGEMSRRHFDAVAERVEASVKVVAELVAHHSSILDDHERRLQRIERPGRL